MGAAKRLEQAKKQQHAALDRHLNDLGVKTDLLGFYDQPAFTSQELLEPSFLEKYAIWVLSRPRTSEYDARTREIVPQVTKFLADLFEHENMQRSCVHFSSMMARILDRFGVWSFALHGSMTMAVPKANLWRGMALCDERDFPNAELGHAWVVAPPYLIVDGTIRLQNRAGDPIADFIPSIVAVEHAKETLPRVEDVVSPRVRFQIAQDGGSFDSQLHHALIPELKNFGRKFRSLEFTVNDLTLRYVPTAVRVSDVSLEEINSEGDYLTGAEVWNDHIYPVFAHYIL